MKFMRNTRHLPRGGTSQGFWFPSLEVDVHYFLISEEHEGDPIVEEFDVQIVNGGPPIERFIFIFIF
jgi:hypothetical protein